MQQEKDAAKSYTVVEKEPLLCDVDQDYAKDKPPLCKSVNFVNSVAALHVFSKVVMVLANVTYLICIVAKNTSDEPLSSKQEMGETLSYYLTFAGSIYEIVFCALPVLFAMCSHCWSVTTSTYCSYIRYGDLQFALAFSPFISVHLHYVGGLYWFFIAVRIFFYCTTFVAVVIVGIRFFIVICCFKIVDIACCSNGEAVEIRDCKHLWKDIGFQLVSLMIKLNTGSSALATYFKIGITQEGPVQTAYLVFTLLSCFNAVAGLLYNLAKLFELLFIVHFVSVAKLFELLFILHFVSLAKLLHFVSLAKLFELLF